MTLGQFDRLSSKYVENRQQSLGALCVSFHPSIESGMTNHVPKLFPGFCPEEYVQTAISGPIVRWYCYLFALCAPWTLTTVVQRYSCSSEQEVNISTSSCGQVVGTHRLIRQRTYSEYIYRHSTTYVSKYSKQIRGLGRPTIELAWK